jgi:hypothetical protein
MIRSKEVFIYPDGGNGRFEKTLNSPYKPSGFPLGAGGFTVKFKIKSLTMY